MLGKNNEIEHFINYYGGDKIRIECKLIAKPPQHIDRPSIVLGSLCYSIWFMSDGPQVGKLRSQDPTAATM